MSNLSSLLSPRLKKYFDDYCSFHKTHGNKLTHSFGIPLIVISLLGMLGHITFDFLPLPPSEFFRIDGGTTLLVFVLGVYFSIDWKITLPFSLFLFGLYFLGRALPFNLNIILFITGWVLQGMGHAVFEKKSPAFSKNLMHLFIGPLWIFSHLIKYR